jgi:hypothetical protein
MNTANYLIVLQDEAMIQLVKILFRLFSFNNNCHSS